MNFFDPLLQALANIASLKPGSVVLALLAAMIIGMLWYGPLFGKQWMALTGVKNTGGSMIPSFTIEIVVTLVRVLVLGIILQSLALTSLGGIFAATLAIALGGGLAITGSDSIWEGRPWGLFALNSSRLLLDTFVIFTMLLYIPF